MEAAVVEEQSTAAAREQPFQSEDTVSHPVSFAISSHSSAWPLMLLDLAPVCRLCVPLFLSRRAGHMSTGWFCSDLLQSYQAHESMSLCYTFPIHPTVTHYRPCLTLLSPCGSVSSVSARTVHRASAMEVDSSSTARTQRYQSILPNSRPKGRLEHRGASYLIHEQGRTHQCQGGVEYSTEQYCMVQTVLLGPITTGLKLMEEGSGHLGVGSHSRCRGF